MDAYLINSQNRRSSFEPAPVLIAADSESGQARARRTVAMAGLRIAASVTIEGARERIDRQAAASALWIELGADPGPATDTLLEHVATDLSHGRYSAVLAAPAAALDRLSRHLLDAGLEVVLDGTEVDRTAALAVATSGAARAGRLSDVTGDRNAARLRQLSDEVGRIAATLARLSTGPAASPRPVAVDTSDPAPEVAVDTIRSIIRARRLRSRFFDEELFADPAWDMLLDLLQAEISTLRVPVSSLCIAAAVPATTALRWIKTMVQQGMFLRRADPHDGRRVFVELAPHTSQSMRRYFAAVDRVAPV